MKILSHGGSGAITKDQLLDDILIGRSIDASTAFSGMGTPEAADRQVQLTCKKVAAEMWCRSGALPPTLSYIPKWAIEFNSKCQEELLNMPALPGESSDFCARGLLVGPLCDLRSA
eukprot:5571003-Alexandrium_andersonii.AAC.1